MKSILKALALAAYALIPLLAGAQTLTVTYPTHQSVSPRMSQLKGAPMVTGPTVIHRPVVPNLAPNQARPDGAQQTSTGTALSVTAGSGFDGMSVYNGGYIPSDNNIAVGPNHVVEVVNAAFAVYSKTGTQLVAPVAMKNLWTNLTGSACAANNGGDVVVQYDRLADRWLVTQLGSLSSPYSECVAVSQTADPGGAYNLYSYSFGTDLNDYPKWSVWPTATNSAYLATYNLFSNGTTFKSAEICAYDRTAMLAGATNPASLCYTGISGASYLPSDLDGATPPPDGTPAYFVDLYGSSLGVYSLTPNFGANTAILSPFSTLGVAGYTSASSSPQPGTTETLDSLSDRLMYRLAFRMFSDHESMVVNHSVAASGGNSGARWYELRSSVSTSPQFSIFQQGTYAPDSSYRWMGSAAMDQAGNIALGYSVSDASSVYPSIRYTGRVPSDPLGTMQAENSIISGAGSQTGYTRWGDYTSMRIDPSDDCTFWYVNEYFPITSSYGWYTRIGSFKFSSCSTSADFSMSATSARMPRSIQGSSTITVTALNGYTSSVYLTPVCTSGWSCSLTPNSVTPTNFSTLAMTPPLSTLPGAYTETVTGTDGSLTHSANAAITVTAPFTVAMGSTSVSVTRGSSKSVSVTATNGDGGYGFPVTLSLSGLPKGVSATFSTNPVSATNVTSGGGSSTLTLSVNRSATKGSYNLIVTGKDVAGDAATASFNLTIN